MKSIVLLICLVIVALGHKHHDTEVEDKWWETIVEFDASEGDIYTKQFSIDSWPLSGNLANFLQIRPVKSITLPVVINLLFGGFGGFGNQIICLQEEQFEPWFGHVDHRVPHLIVPVGEEQTTTQPYPTEQSKIFYGYHLNLIKLAPMFNTILQDQILWNLRPETPNLTANFTGLSGDEVLIEFKKSKNNDGKFYVDVDHISAFLQAAATGIGLKDSYNFYILNPSTSVYAGEVYGYRSGFSGPELKELIDIWAEELEDEESLYELLGIELEPCDTEEPEPLPEYLLPQLQSERVNVVDYTDLTKEWAEWFIKKQHNAEKKKSMGIKDDPSQLFAFARGEPKSVIQLAETIITEGSESEKDYLFDILLGEGTIQENCLVDSWITTGRTFFMDLTAGPFSWGPLLTNSDGFKSKNTIPKVPDYDYLNHEKDHAHDEDVKEMVADRIRVLERSYSLHCSADSDSSKNPLCKEILKDLQVWVDRHTRLLRDVKSDEIKGSEEEGEDADWVMDNFLSHLSGSISKSIRQVLVPGSPLYSIPYTEKIVYHFFQITSHESYDPRGPGAFDFEFFKSEISKLKYPSQKVSFVTQQLSMADSKDLATAFHNAKRSVLLPTISPDGIYINTEVHYIDSVVLRDSLSKMREIKKASGNSYDGTRHIPILFFSLDYINPILVDKYYLAKGLSDMVIIVQNSQEIISSRIQCNGNTIYLNLKNPIKHALSATSLVAGGIIPQHISYSEAHQKAIQDWHWSVGDNPYSHTSNGATFNRIQIDITRRNMLITELTNTIDTINQGVSILKKIRLDETNSQMSHHISLNELSILFTNVIGKWKKSCGFVAALDFESAMKYAKEADIIANEFLLLVIDTDELMSAYQCLPHAVTEVDTESQLILIIPILFVLFDILLGIIVFMCSRKSSSKGKKAKIN